MIQPSSVCFFCGASVHPTEEGLCPPCTRYFKPAEEGQTEVVASPAPTTTAPSLQAQLLTKVTIFLFVFPTFAWLVSALIGLVLVLPSIILPETAQAAVIGPIEVFSQLSGLIGAILVSRQFWPKEEPPVQW